MTTTNDTQGSSVTTNEIVALARVLADAILAGLDAALAPYAAASAAGQPIGREADRSPVRRAA